MKQKIEPEESVNWVSLSNDLVKRSKLETLNWAMQLCGSGATVGMIRKILHNKFVEVAGEGEKA